MTRWWPTLRFLIGVVAAALSLMAAVLGVWSVAPVLLGNRSANLIVSDSMRPAFGRGDIVLSVPTDGVGLAPPTVIVFDASRGRLIHRIHEALPNGAYITKGDSNEAPDSDPVVPSQVRGTGRIVLPTIGLGILWAREGRWGLAALWVGAMVSLIVMGRWGVLDRFDPWNQPSRARRRRARSARSTLDDDRDAHDLTGGRTADLHWGDA